MTNESTLLLDLDEWDLVLDSAGNVALAEPPYALAQDVASACRTRYGELWYDTLQGVRHDNILGQRPQPQFIRAQLVQAAMSVPNVARAQVALVGATDRVLTGQIDVTDNNGVTHNVRF